MGLDSLPAKNGEKISDTNFGIEKIEIDFIALLIKLLYNDKLGVNFDKNFLFRFYIVKEKNISTRIFIKPPSAFHQPLDI